MDKGKIGIFFENALILILRKYFWVEGRVKEVAKLEVSFIIIVHFSDYLYFSASIYFVALMSALSKLGNSTFTKMVVLPAIGGIGRTSSVCIVRHGHGHVFRRRQGQLAWNRAKDNWHFYIIGIGLLPCFYLVVFLHVYFGPCELTEYPTEGPPPRYWQFERTPLRQFYTWFTGKSDMKYTDSYLSLFARLDVRNKWRVIEQRVKHLQSERLDYKGYYYHPLTNQWLEFSKKRAANTMEHLHHLAQHRM